jgi:hypothetical protein
LPPEQELGPVENIYLAPDAVARDGPARVLVGTHGGATSSLNAPASLNYLAVRLRAGESWRYQPAVDHTVGWVSPGTGRLRVPETVEAGELAIFEPSNGAIDFHAEADTEFVLGSAAPHAHDLVLGPYAVPGSERGLRSGVCTPVLIGDAVGGTRLHKVNVRIVAASNRDLRKAVERGDFREDLFDRPFAWRAPAVDVPYRFGDHTTQEREA